MDALDALLERSQAGDRGALDELVRSQVGRLYATAFHVTRDAHLAEDVVQEVFVKVVSPRAPFRGRGSSQGWLLRTTVHLALDLMRSGRARARRERAYGMDRPKSVTERDRVSSAEDRAVLERALAGLPALTRACLWLRFGEELSVREVAAAIGKGKSATAERIERGLESLRTDLSARDVTLGAALPLTEALRALPRPAAPVDLASRIVAVAQEGVLAGAATATSTASASTVSTAAATGGLSVSAKYLIATVGVAALFVGLVTWRVVSTDPSTSSVSLPKETAAIAGGQAASERSPETGSGGGSTGAAPPTIDPPAVASPEELSGTERLLVRVVDEDGAPVPYAWLMIRHEVEPREESYAESDEEGVFESELETGPYYVLAWRDDLKHDGERVELEHGEEKELQLVLGPASHIVGVAYLEDRTVPLRNASMDLIGYGRPRAAPTVATDGSGKFVLGPFLTGDEFVQLGYRDFRVVTLPVELEGRRPQEVEVIFTKGVTVFGFVTDTIGNPVPGVDVSWLREHTPKQERLTVTSDENGRYELRGLDGARYYVRVEGIGYQEREPEQVVLGGDAAREVPLVVDCVPTFEVRVEDTDGQPVSGIEIEVYYRLSRVAGSRSLTTDENGIARVACVPRGIDVRIAVRDRGSGFGETSWNTSQPGPALLRIQPNVRIVGRVVDADGIAIEGSRVEARRSGEFRVQRATSNDAGSFELELSEGEYRVTAASPRRGAAILDVVVRGEANDELRLELGTSPALHVRVVDSDGKPVESASVEFRAISSRNPFLDSKGARTDADGWCTVAAETGVEYVVRARMGSREVQSASSVTSGSPASILQLPPEDAISASGIVLHDGKPVPGARVGYWRVHGHWFGGDGATTTDAYGRFSFKTLYVREGLVYFHAWGPGFSFARSAPIEAPLAAPVEDLTIESLPGTDLEVKIVDPEGHPAPRARVALYQETSPPVSASASTDGKGSVRFARLPLGKYQVQVQSADERLSFRTELDWQGEESPLEWKLKPGR